MTLLWDGSVLVIRTLDLKLAATCLTYDFFTSTYTDPD